MHIYTISSVLANKCKLQLSIVVLNSFIEKGIVVAVQSSYIGDNPKVTPGATYEGLPAVILRR